MVLYRHSSNKNGQKRARVTILIFYIQSGKLRSARPTESGLIDVTESGGNKNATGLQS